MPEIDFWGDNLQGEYVQADPADYLVDSRNLEIGQRLQLVSLDPNVEPSPRSRTTLLRNSFKSRKPTRLV